MIIKQQSVSIRNADRWPLQEIEYAGRNCYASQDRIGPGSAESFVNGLLKRGHGAPLEFADMTVEIETSRAILAELTRHRLASFCVESQRYIQEAKSGDITFIAPDWYNESDEDEKSAIWHSAMRMAENAYKQMIENGARPEQAREVLPNSTACKIIMKANLREWRHIFALRCDKAAYPPMRMLMKDLLDKAHERIPVVFDDLYKQFICPDNQDETEQPEQVETAQE